MYAEVVAETREFYARNGFAVVEQLLERDELEQWRGAVDHAVEERGRRLFAFDLEDQDRARLRLATDAEEARKQREYYERVFTQRNNLWQTDEEVRRLMLQPELGQLVADVAGVDRLRIWHDQALIKEPYGNPTAFHLDVPFWSFCSPDAITIWIALDDATLENGCLYYLPGSHLARKYDNVGIGPELGALFEVYPEWKGIDAVPCPVPAGGALFHNGLTAHGAGANMTPRKRRAMTCAYMPDGCTFNGTPNVLPPPYLKTLQVGDPLDNEEQNPLVFARPSRENLRAGVG